MVNDKGLIYDDIKTFLDLIIKANDCQIQEMLNRLVAEKDKRFAERRAKTSENFLSYS